MIEKILLAVAGRGLCEEMFNMLTEIPVMQKASVTVLHVVTPQVTAEAMSAKLEEGGKILADAVKSLRVDPEKITPRLKQGDPKDVVLQVAQEEQADLIIMGSRGLKRIESILENSVSQYVFQLSSRPMLLVKDEIYVKRVNRIMVAMDKSDSAKQSLDIALSLLRDIKGSQLYLVRVNPDKQKPSGEVIDNPELDPVLASAATEAKKQGVAYRCINSTGEAGREICRLADEMSVDLLILGSPERRPSIAKALPDLDRLLGTSLSDYVRVYANCPVLLSRTPG
ncbi:MULTISPECIES: universal stress protein [unclassified Coleofasciculus]|uniref:universal stress protein n=1 Tax=unclassified Coleofasciculus TaxID=2692782 RepID=UPI0018814363|nr:MULTISPECIES: universal stress protein [unclassified Coleofasciculus]MBE9126325.1 universal stress protein [Coleofasciculus sp. LEGE 07081]MBE9147498.1 universal stress protein [Coleofasciculus sp. LEGE 07092]